MGLDTIQNWNGHIIIANKGLCVCKELMGFFSRTSTEDWTNHKRTTIFCPLFGTQTFDYWSKNVHKFFRRCIFVLADKCLLYSNCEVCKFLEQKGIALMSFGSSIYW